MNGGAAPHEGAGRPLRRAVRIAAVAAVLPFLVRLSQQVGEASGNPPVEGMHWAFAVLALLFTLRAFATEVSRGPEANRIKDLQWGLAGGCVIAALWRAGVLGG